MEQDTKQSTFNKYLNPLFVKKIYRIIKKLKLNRYVKKLDIITFIQLFVYAQLNQIGSLQDISLALNENQLLQRKLGLSSISVSQLSRKLRDVDPEVCLFVFRYCVNHIMKHHGNKALKKPGVTRLMSLIDASTIPLCVSKYPWAEFRNTKAGVKIHLKLVFSDDITFAEKMIITPAKCADKTQMDELISIDKDCLYVFDRGYVDYEKFDELCDHSVRFATRLKSNAAYEVIEETPVPTDSPITYAAKIRLGSRYTYVMKNPLYLIETKDSKGNVIRIITNDFSLKAEEVSEAYKNRWQIELFFKWIKQHLNVKKMYGTSQNAVYNQLYIALITHCLLVILQLTIDQKKKLLIIRKYVQLYWNESFGQFLEAVLKSPTKNSKGRGKPLPVERILEETQWQYENGETEHLDTVDYDPI
jgi:hypothetical protein